MITSPLQSRYCNLLLLLLPFIPSIHDIYRKFRTKLLSCFVNYTFHFRCIAKHTEYIEAVAATKYPARVFIDGKCIKIFLWGVKKVFLIEQRRWNPCLRCTVSKIQRILACRFIREAHFLATFLQAVQKRKKKRNQYRSLFAAFRWILLPLPKATSYANLVWCIENIREKLRACAVKEKQRDEMRNLEQSVVWKRWHTHLYGGLLNNRHCAPAITRNRTRQHHAGIVRMSDKVLSLSLSLSLARSLISPL